MRRRDLHLVSGYKIEEGVGWSICANVRMGETLSIQSERIQGLVMIRRLSQSGVKRGDLWNR